MAKILYLARFLNTVNGGGSSVSLDIVANQMIDQGHDVDVLVTDIINIKPAPAYDILDKTGMYEDKRQDEILRELRSEIADKSSSYDIIHIFSPSLLPIIGSNIDSISCPTVGRLNTYSLFCTNFRKMDGTCHSKCGLVNKFSHDTNSVKSKVMRLPRYFSKTYLEPRWTSNIDHFFAISPAVKKIYVDYGIPKNKITVIPNMMENLEESQSSCNKLSREDTDLNLLYLGRLESAKGVDLLIDAVKGLNSENIHLDVVGAGSEMETLQASVPDSDSNKITFHGRVPHSEIGRYYSQSDLFVHPHIWPEPFGRVILESMQYECPVLSADIGAPPWICGSAGYEFKARNSDDLRTKIRYAANNTDEIVDMRGQTSVEIQRFSKEQIVPLIELEYDKLAL